MVICTVKCGTHGGLETECTESREEDYVDAFATPGHGFGGVIDVVGLFVRVLIAWSSA